MAKTYYTFPDEVFPSTTGLSGMVLSIMEAIRYHYSANVLYRDEAYSVSKDRWVLADATTSMQMRGNEKQFNWSNARFPFTAYTMGELVVDDRVPNFYAKSHRYYSSLYDRIIYANPMVLEITMYTFFNTAIDYHRAQTLLQDDDAIKTLKEVPIYINNQLTSFPILIDPEIIKGNLAYEFEQQLKAGKIFDINHSTKIYYHDLIVSSDSTTRVGGFTLAPVEDMQVAIKSLASKELGQTQTYTSGSVVDTPQVTSTSPVSGSTNVSVNINPVFNFNATMNKASVQNNLEFVPGINADYVWNDNWTQLTLNKIDPFVSGTSYSVSLAKNAYSTFGVKMQDDYDFTFVTG